MNGQFSFLLQTTREQHACIAPHQHQCYELVYYREGLGTTRVGDVTYQFHDSTFTVIKPHTRHDERHEFDTNVICIGFQMNAGTYALREGLYLDQLDSPILPLLQAMRMEMQHKRSYYAAKLNHLVGELIIELLRYDTFSSTNPTIDKLIYAKNYIDENVSHPISVETLAELVGYSYDRFRHLFKETYGLSPMNYVMSKRFEIAKRLLLQTNLSISAVGGESGFANDAQFCSLFKKEMGMTPRHFRLSGES
ncbi:helix-turn-helix domain-containing protein [Paenibacillus roseipurpureus]|uniref:AraC family transcriptional regulator n=1 Tax=Paenibacillus roseopurpureus TaxID=2918901 RepID=A0AA96RIY5_9BACL|nr:AraC family transcriptional regulator [Paenibacillus sp. MBLB1832]WNR42739.1 AraC family transcriptional regulator [Paenibacillus sp. MBLB1832]